VITSQHKAWNDEVRMAMYVELLLAPWGKKVWAELHPNDELLSEAEWVEILLWMDNCALHKTSSVQEVLREYKITSIFCPLNMTDLLLICDLIVHGIIKKFIRKKRVELLVQSFRAHKEGCNRS